MNARYYMASCDQRYQDEKDSEQLYRVVGEEEQDDNKVSSANINPVVRVLDIVSSSWPTAIVVRFNVKKINSCRNGESQ